MSGRKPSIERDLREWFSGAKRVVVAGIGNPIRMDDFVGVRIVQGLQGKVSGRVMLIECETAPEGFTQQIVDFKPTHVLLIDAALLELKPGEARLVDPAKLTTFPAYSTHMLPLRLFCEYLIQTTGARIGLLLVQPRITDFGEGLSQEVAQATRVAVSTLIEVFPREASP
jgi:hydrogenase 3 maturation protease